MKLDQKYFVPFLAIMAIATALIITFFTISNRSSKEKAFKKRIAAQDSLQSEPFAVFDGPDSLSVESFEGKFVVLDFWSTWTESFSLQGHQQLARLLDRYPNRLAVVAAIVEDTPENVNEYIGQYAFPFRYVQGTQVFNKYEVAGVPTQLVYTPSGCLHSVFMGYADSTRLDSLTKIVGDGE